MVFVNLCENRVQSQRSAFSGSPLSPLDCYEHFIIEFNPNTCCKKKQTRIFGELGGLAVD